jgi:hypothetical protein
MPFPTNQEALFAAGYEYLKWERCPVCTLDVEVWTAPGDYEIVMDPMPGFKSLAVRHCVTCKTREAPPVAVVPKPSPEPERAPDVAMHGVTDPNHQLIAVGYDPVTGTLVCQFKTAKWSYGPGVPEAEFMKLRHSPFAYRIFTCNIKGKFTATKLS